MATSKKSARFERLLIITKPVFAANPGGDLPPVLSFRAKSVDQHKTTDYFPFKVWGDKAVALKDKVEAGLVFDCVASPKSRMVEIIGKGGKPLMETNGSGKPRRISEVFFTILSINLYKQVKV